MLLSLPDSVGRPVSGAGQVTRWRNPAASQLFTSETDYPKVPVTGVTPIGTFAALTPLSPSGDAWQVLLTCVAMATFAIVTILRRLRRHG
jgi:hypothetical protein